MTAQQPTPPGWQPQPPPAPPQPPRRSWLQVVAIVVLAALGLILGGMTGSAFVVVDYALGTILMLVGMWLGLTLGIWFGFWVTSPNRRPVDAARYPNRTISITRRR